MADARSPSGCASSARRLLFFRSCSGDANVILPLDRVKDRDLIPDPFRAVTPESSPNGEARWLDLHGVSRPRPATPASPPRPSGPRRHRPVAHHSRLLTGFPIPALGSFWSASRKSIRKPSPRVPSHSRREARVFTERPTRPPRSGPLTPPRSLSSPGLCRTPSSSSCMSGMSPSQGPFAVSWARLFVSFRSGLSRHLHCENFFDGPP